MGAPNTLAEIVGRYVDTQIAVLLDAESRLLDGQIEAVHPARVAIRRLRSTLRSFDVYKRSAAETFGGELQWFGSVLGEVRDLDVQSRRLAAALDIVGDRESAVAAAALLDDEVAARSRTAWVHVGAALGSPRYARLRTALADWTEAPPLRKRANRPANTVVDYVDAADRSLRKRIDAAIRAAAEGSDTHPGARTRRARPASATATPPSWPYRSSASPAEDSSNSARPSKTHSASSKTPPSRNDSSTSWPGLRKAPPNRRSTRFCAGKPERSPTPDRYSTTSRLDSTSRIPPANSTSRTHRSQEFAEWAPHPRRLGTSPASTGHLTPAEWAPHPRRLGTSPPPSGHLTLPSRRKSGAHSAQVGCPLDASRVPTRRKSGAHSA